MEKSCSASNSMMAVTSIWGNNKTFRLIPLDRNCPFVEGIFDADNKIMVLISLVEKEGFHMVTKLDDNGDPVPTKKLRLDPKNKYKEERKLIKTFHENYIIEASEMKEILNLLCVNKDFDFEKYINAVAPEPAVKMSDEVAEAIKQAPVKSKTKSKLNLVKSE